MASNQRKTVFALDPGATNWRLYRAVYEESRGRMRLRSEPAASPLTSFTERRLPSALLLTEDGEGLAGCGEAAQLAVEDDGLRPNVRAYFKPSIGVHLLRSPLPHQQRFTHEEALRYTQLLLEEVLAGIRREKWRGAPFDHSFILSVAHPVHWAEHNGGSVLEDFKRTVTACLPEDSGATLRFVSEPEAAIHSLQRRGLLPEGSEETCLIVDIGGSTMDLVASERGNGEVVFQARYGAPLGGDLLDDQIAVALAEELDIPAGALEADVSLGLRLRAVSRHLKESLSRQLLQEQQVHVVPQRAVTLIAQDGTVYRGRVRLDQARFEAVTAGLQERFEAQVERALDAMHVAAQDVARVLLVGGGSQLYSVVNYLRARFGAGRVMMADNPAETVAHGVSLEYGAAAARARPTLFFQADLDRPTPRPEDAEKSPLWKLESPDGQQFILTAGEHTIGRLPSSAIHLRTDKVSRTHARLSLSADEAILVDLGSTNGTCVNDETLPADTIRVVPEGADVRFGDQHFTLKRISSTEG